MNVHNYSNQPFNKANRSVEPSSVPKISLEESSCDLKISAWNLMKYDQKLPADLRNKLVQIEESLETMDGRKLIDAFFQSLFILEKSKSIKELDFSKLESIQSLMSSAFQADQDYNLGRCWLRIAPNVGIEQGYMTPSAIRVWMSLKENQQKLAKIQRLDLSHLNLTNVPSEIMTYFSGLTWFCLSDNKLTSLPSSIANFTALEELLLGYNNLRVLPESIGNLKALRVFSVRNNQLMDLPKSFWNLEALKNLYLNDNRLTCLPSLIGNLAALRFLNLERNRLTSLPDSIGNLAALEELYLTDNRLVSLPKSMVSLGKNTGSLKEFNIDGDSILLIPDCVLSTFNSNPGIQLFIDLRNFQLRPYLSKVCQMIRKESENILNNKFTKEKELGCLVDKLERVEKEQLYLRIWELGSGNKELDPYSWGKRNRFNHMDFFVSALAELRYQNSIFDK